MQFRVQACLHACKNIFMHAAGMKHACCMHAQFRRVSWHFCCFPDTTVQRSFFLTFTPAKNIALNFRTKTSINFLKCFWYIFGFAFRMGTTTCHPSPSLPSTTTESSKQSLCSYLVFSKQTSSQFISFL